jgi:hypothetical protein
MAPTFLIWLPSSVCQLCQLIASPPSTTNLHVTGWASFLGAWDQMRTLSRIFIVVLCLLLTRCVMLPGKAKAQPQDSEIQQTQSVVDAARHSREIKRNAPTPAKVITNDDLDSLRAKGDHEDYYSHVLTSPRADSSNIDDLSVHRTPDRAAILNGGESAPNRQESDEAAAEIAEIARLTDRLDSAENALHWQQRQFLLLQNTVYSNPAYTTTQAGKSQLDSAQLQIEETQQEIESLKEPLAELEWRHWRRKQAERSENGSAAEEYNSPPPSVFVLPKP